MVQVPRNFKHPLMELILDSMLDPTLKIGLWNQEE